MIERELTIIMRCDKCGGVLIDDYGHIIRLDGDISSYPLLNQRATDLGWRCDEGSCLCLRCRKEWEDD